MSCLDKYPTRNSLTSGVQDRIEPVIHSTSNSKGLIKDFDELGYLHIKYQEDWKELKESVQNYIQLCKLKSYSLEDRANLHFVYEENNNELKSIFGLFDNCIIEYLSMAGALSLVKSILGENIYLHQTRLNLKPPFRGREFGWHSDFETWHSEDGMPLMRALSVMIATTENTKLNGSLLVIPGSHKYFVSCPGETPKNNYKSSLVNQSVGIIPEQELKFLVQKGGMELLELCEGDIVLFDCNLAHASNLNLSVSSRENLFICINSLDNTLKKPFSNNPPRPSFLAARVKLRKI